jgi:hypothetical protein
MSIRNSKGNFKSLNVKKNFLPNINKNNQIKGSDGRGIYPDINIQENPLGMSIITEDE